MPVLALALLALGLFLDFGGGFGIKAATSGLVLLWLLTRRSTWTLWRRSGSDLVAFVLLPAAIGLGRLVSGPSTLADGLRNMYGAQSGLLFVLFLPLVYAAGTQRSYAILRQGFRALSVVMLVVAACHFLGWINLGAYTPWAERYGVGFVGLDPRQAGASVRIAFVLLPRIAQALPVAFGLEIARSTTWFLVLCAVALVTKARGLVVAAVAVFVASTWPSGRRSVWTRMARRLAAVLAIGLVLLAVLPANAALPLLGANAQEVLLRVERALAGTDLSALTRVGHLEGYWQRVTDDPMVAVWGAGPGATLFNKRLNRAVRLTELPVLNLAMWYGIPYTLFYVTLLVRASLQLWGLRHHPLYTDSDAGMVVGSMVFWVTSNINPLMTSPFALLVYVILRARVFELKDGAAGWGPALAPFPSLEGEPR